MDEHCRPEPLHLLIFVKKLREVFDVCGKDSDGFVRHEHLLHLGSQFGREEQVKKLAKCLDSDSHGRISFKDFCRGVLTLKGYVGIRKTKSRAQFIRGPYKTAKNCCQVPQSESDLH